MDTKAKTTQLQGERSGRTLDLCWKDLVKLPISRHQLSLMSEAKTENERNKKDRLKL